MLSSLAIDDEPFDNDFEVVEEEDVSRFAEDHSLSAASNRVYFRCEKCAYQTQIRYLLDRHIAKHMMDQPFKCMTCDYSNFNHSDFVDHLSKHQKTKLIQCPFCPHRSHLSSMKTHMPRHRSIEMFDCSICEFSSNYVNSMKNHMEVYHTKTYRCKVCGTLMTKHSLKIHCETFHGRAKSSRCGSVDHRNCNCRPDEQDLSKESPKSPESSSATINDFAPKSENGESDSDLVRSRRPKALPNAVQKFHCRICAFSTAYAQSLDKHFEAYHAVHYLCPHCPAVMTRFQLCKHSESVHGVRIGFRSCLKRANDENTTGKQSKKEFPNIEPDSDLCKGFEILTCSLCDFSSRHKSSLEYHKLCYHKKLLKCKPCGEVMTKYEIIDHLKNAHGAELPKTGRCRLVETVPETPKRGLGQEADSDKSEARIPKREPSDDDSDEDFACELCTFSTKWSGSLYNHVKSQHKTQYICKDCNVFMSKYDLILHREKVHGVTSNRNLIPYNSAQFMDSDSSDDEDYNPRLSVNTALNKDRERLIREQHPEESASGSDPNNDHCTASNDIVQPEIKVSSKKDLIDYRNEQSAKGIPYPTVTHAGHGGSRVMEHHNKQAPEDMPDLAIAPSGVGGSATDGSSGISKHFKTSLDTAKERHAMTFRPKKYTCRLCYAVMSRYDYSQHVKNKCGAGATRRKTRRMSIMNKPDDPQNTDSTKQKSAVGFHCNKCKFFSIYRGNFKRHLSQYHENDHLCNKYSAVTSKCDSSVHSKEAYRVRSHQRSFETTENAKSVRGIDTKNLATLSAPCGQKIDTSSKVLNPKFAINLKTALTAHQPVVVLEKIRINDIQ